MGLCFVAAIPNVTLCIIWHKMTNLARNVSNVANVTFGTRKGSVYGGVYPAAEPQSMDVVISEKQAFPQIERQSRLNRGPLLRRLRLVDHLAGA